MPKCEKRRTRQQKLMSASFNVAKTMYCTTFLLHLQNVAKTLYRAPKNDAKVQKHCTGHQKLIKIKQYLDFCDFKFSFCCYTQCLLLRASIFAALHNVFALWHRFLLLYTAFLDIVLQKRCAGQQKSMPVSIFGSLYCLFPFRHSVVGEQPSNAHTQTVLKHPYAKPQTILKQLRAN